MDILDETDEYEGYLPENPDESVFIREETDVQLAGPGRNTVKAFVYYIPENQLNRFFFHPIPDGNWKL